MDWHEFDVERAEVIHQRVVRQVAMPDPARLADLETALDWYHRFSDLDLSLLDEEEEDDEGEDEGDE
jgi:hypothetical protein